MPSISRHIFPIKPEGARMGLRIEDETLPSAFAAPIIPFARLVGILQGSLNALPLRSFLDPADPLILEDLRRIACAAASIFAAESSPTGTEVSVPAPHHETRIVVSEGPKPSLAHTITWQQGFYAAVAAREREATEVLCQVTADTLRRGQASSDAWFYRSVDALQSLVRKREDAEAKLLAAMKETDPEKANTADKNWILDVAFPVLELAWQIHARDGAKFDAAMQKALEGHKHFYAKAQGKKELMGLIALGPLAMAVVAKDRGITTSVESDYLPRWIIDR